jgi:hypothetical protein
MNGRAPARRVGFRREMRFGGPKFFIRIEHGHRLAVGDGRGELQIKIVPDAQVVFFQRGVKHAAFEADRFDRVALAIDENGKLLCAGQMAFGVVADKIPNRERRRIGLLRCDERQLNQVRRDNAKLMGADGRHSQGIIVGNDQFLRRRAEKGEERETSGEQAGAKHFSPWRSSPVLAKPFVVGFYPISLDDAAIAHEGNYEGRVGRNLERGCKENVRAFRRCLQLFENFL